MKKVLCKRVLPFFFVITILCGILPVGAMAAPPSVEITDSDGQPDEGCLPDRSSQPAPPPTEPDKPESGSAPPDSSPPPTDSQPPDAGNEPETSLPPAPGDEEDPAPLGEDADHTDNDGDALNGAEVGIFPARMSAQNASPYASGNLSIHKFPQYQWDFGFSHGASEMRPWYIMDIDGRLAYCIEPTNPDTTSGGYGAIDYDALNIDQQNAIGFAMLYGAQDASNPLMHMATQAIIWEIIYGYMDLTGYTALNRQVYNATIGHNPAAAGFYEQILTGMRNHTQVPSFTRVVKNLAPTHKVSGIPGEYKVDLVNTNPRCSLQDFQFTNTGTVRFVKDGETLKVTSSAPLDGGVVYGAFKGAASETRSLVFWRKGSEQVRATAGILDPVPAYFRLSTEDVGKYTITVKKLQAGTNNPLAGAEFEVRHAEKGVVGVFTTDGSGTLTVSVPWQGTYIVTEITPPKGHLLARDPVKDVVITTDNPKATVSFHNEPFSGIQITKVDATTRQRIAGVTFRIARKGGGEAQEIVTGPSGIATLANLRPDWYTVQEISCPPGYILDMQVRTVEISSGEVCEITIENYAKPSLEIAKVDADTGQRLAGATFRVAKKGSKDFKDVVGGPDGIARLTGLEPDYYTVTEIVAPNGYILNAQEHTIEIIEGKVSALTLQNRKKPSLEILKIDSITKQPLAHATFRISYKNGEVAGRFTSDEEGRIFLDGMAPGLVVVEEITAPDGYLVTNAPQEVLLKGGEAKTITFENTPKSPVIIKKIDSATGEPLPGAVFRLTKMNGELVGEYATGRHGFVTIPALKPGWYVAVEILAPEGYKLNDTPRNVEVKLGESAIIEFENTPLPGLQIRKVDAVTQKPLQGVTIRVCKLSGEVIGDYKTNLAGLITLPDAQPGWYTAYEVASIPGYILDTTPQNVELKAGKTATLEFLNKPLAGLTIVKQDSVTGRGLAGVAFELTHLDGAKIGSYTTDADGRLFVPNLQEGWIFAREVAAPKGYKLDTQEQRLEIKAGVQNVLTFKNQPYPFLVIQKVDADSGQPLEGVKFRLFSDNGREVGTFTTGASGRIVLTGMDAGHYQLQEAEAAPGYLLDNRVWDITLEWGKTTTVKFKNVLELGQIQIVKVAAEDNSLTGQKKGDLLEGAVFEIADEKREVVDTITSDKRGLATSRPLPLGKYTIKEVQSPAYWLMNSKTFEAVITKHKETIRFTVENAAPKIDTTVEKRGIVEAIPGTSIRYDFKNIANTSNVPLEDFYWHDLLPTDAVRLESIYTGTWNEPLTYKVMYKTNLKSRWTTLAENLLTKNNNRLDCSPQALGLAANEFVTEFQFEFGTVKAGFKEETAPFIFVKVLPELPNGYQFTNRTDVGGRYGEKWTYDKDAWTTIVYKTPEAKGRLPKTGV